MVSGFCRVVDICYDISTSYPIIDETRSFDTVPDAVSEMEEGGVAKVLLYVIWFRVLYGWVSALIF